MSESSVPSEKASTEVTEPPSKANGNLKLKKTKSVKFDSSTQDNEFTSKRYSPSDLLLDYRRGSEGCFNKAAIAKALAAGSILRRASEPALSITVKPEEPSTKTGSSATMEGGLAAYTSGPIPDRGHRATTKSLHVEFAPVGEVKERKEKYLTAKYGAHQMSLIRKRLGVEMWMYDQLQMLYLTPKDGKSNDKEVDIDELLDMEDEKTRRKSLLKMFSDCTQSSDKIEKFVDELLERAKTL